MGKFTEVVNDFLRHANSPAEIEAFILKQARLIAKNPKSVDILKAAYQRKLDDTVNQLMTVSRQLFLELEPALTVDNLSQNKDWADAFKRYTNAATNLSHHVTDDVMSHVDINARTMAMERWLTIADHCYQAGDFHSAKAIEVALQNSSIIRLKVTSAGLSPEAVKIMQAIPFVANKHEAAIKMMNDAGATKPVIPFMGSYQSQITFACDTKHNADKKINMDVRQKIIRDSVVTPLIAMIESQKKNSLPVVATISEFTETALTKVPEKDADRDKQLYEVSKKYEPKDQQDEMFPSGLLQPKGKLAHFICDKAKTAPKPKETRQQSPWDERKFKGFNLTSHREYYGSRVIDNPAFMSLVKWYVELANNAPTSAIDRRMFLAREKSIDRKVVILTAYKNDLETKLREDPDNDRYRERLDKTNFYLTTLADVQKKLHTLKAAPPTKFSAYGSRVSWVEPENVQTQLKALRQRMPVSTSDLSITTATTDTKVELPLAPPDKHSVAVVTNELSAHIIMHTVMEKRANHVYVDQHPPTAKGNRLFKSSSAFAGIDEDTLKIAVKSIDDALSRFGNQLVIKGAPDLTLRAMTIYCAFLNSQGRHIVLSTAKGGPDLTKLDFAPKHLPDMAKALQKISPDMAVIQAQERKAIRDVTAVEVEVMEKLRNQP